MFGSKADAKQPLPNSVTHEKTVQDRDTVKKKTSITKVLTKGTRHNGSRNNDKKTNNKLNGKISRETVCVRALWVSKYNTIAKKKKKKRVRTKYQVSIIKLRDEMGSEKFGAGTRFKMYNVTGKASIKGGEQLY